MAHCSHGYQWTHDGTLGDQTIYTRFWVNLFVYFTFHFQTPVFQHGALLVLLIGPYGTNFNETLMEILTFSFKEMHLKVSSAKCININVLNLPGCSLQHHLWAIHPNNYEYCLL